MSTNAVIVMELPKRIQEKGAKITLKNAIKKLPIPMATWQAPEYYDNFPDINVNNIVIEIPQGSKYAAIYNHWDGDTTLRDLLNHHFKSVDAALAMIALGAVSSIRDDEFEGMVELVKKFGDEPQKCIRFYRNRNWGHKDNNRPTRKNIEENNPEFGETISEVVHKIGVRQYTWVFHIDHACPTKGKWKLGRVKRFVK